MKHLRPFILSIALMTCVGMSAANFGTKADTSIVKKYQDSIALYKARYDSIKNVHVQNGYASVNSKFYLVGWKSSKHLFGNRSWR